jgi:hypothetical protein
MLIVRRLNCIDAAAGIVTLSNWPSGAPDGQLLRVTITDAASLKFKLLTMSIQCSKHVEDYNKRTVK